MRPIQICAVSRRWHSQPSLTVIFYIYRLQTSTSVHLHLPLFSQSLSKTPYDRSSFSQKKTSQRTPRRTFFNLPQRTTTRPAARTSLFQSGGMFAVVRFDFEVRGQLITLSPGPNTRVTNANVYENGWRYS